MELRRQEYVQVLYAWNDRLNTNLSLMGSYFGDEARRALDDLYEDFKSVGRDVDAAVRAAKDGENASAIIDRVRTQFEGSSGSLNDRVYQVGLTLMGQLRDEQVGRRAPNKSVPRSGRPAGLGG